MKTALMENGLAKSVEAMSKAFVESRQEIGRLEAEIAELRKKLDWRPREARHLAEMIVECKYEPDKVLIFAQRLLGLFAKAEESGEGMRFDDPYLYQPPKPVPEGLWNPDGLSPLPTADTTKPEGFWITDIHNKKERNS